MNRIFHLLLISLIGFAPLSYARMGTSDGGGGKGVKCGRDIKTLDLFEAHLKGWPNPVSQKNFEDDLYLYGTDYLTHMTESIDAFNGPIDQEIILNVFKEQILSKIQDIPKGTRLTLTHDATIPKLPNGCEIVQLAVYSYTEDKIYRDREYWDSMTSIDQAALVLHEALYYRARVSGGAIKSDEARNVIGRMLTRQELNPLFSPVWFSKSHLVCVAGATNSKNVYEFLAVDETRKEGRGVGIYFGAVNHRYVISFTSAFILGVSTKNILERNFTKQSFQATNHVTNEKWNLELSKSPDAAFLNIKEQTSTEPSVGFCQKEIRESL